VVLADYFVQIRRLRSLAGAVLEVRERKHMKTLKPYLIAIALVGFGVATGCSTSAKSPDVSVNVRASLDQAGFKEVSASQDRDKGVITLSGHVGTDADKSQAQSIVQGVAVGQVVSNQIAVVPRGGETGAKAVNYDLDKGIARNLDAALIEARIHDHVKYDVKNHVVTLSGDVGSRAERSQAEQIATSVPNVQQVVNEIQVKKQKATSSN
jgi:hyperosmotically inducible protein